MGKTEGDIVEAIEGIAEGLYDGRIVGPVVTARIHVTVSIVVAWVNGFVTDVHVAIEPDCVTVGEPVHFTPRYKAAVKLKAVEGKNVNI